MMEVSSLSLNLEQKVILDDINLNIESNAIYGLIGQNGAGKSTFFKSILNASKHSGSIIVDDSPIKNNEIGKLIEYPYFYENLSLLDNLKIHSNYLKIDFSEILEVLSTVGLSENRHQKVSELSLGMKQRLGIARAFLGKNKMFLLDEPQNGLDPIWIKKIRGIFVECLKKPDVYSIISSHNLNELHKIVDYFIFMNAGKIICKLKNRSDDSFLLIRSKDKIISHPEINYIGNGIYVSDMEIENLPGSDVGKMNIDIKKISLEELYEQIIIHSSEV